MLSQFVTYLLRLKNIFRRDEITGYLDGIYLIADLSRAGIG